MTVMTFISVTTKQRSTKDGITPPLLQGLWLATNYS